VRRGSFYRRRFRHDLHSRPDSVLRAENGGGQRRSKNEFEMRFIGFVCENRVDFHLLVLGVGQRQALDRGSWDIHRVSSSVHSVLGGASFLRRKNEHRVFHSHRTGFVQHSRHVFPKNSRKRSVRRRDFHFVHWNANDQLHSHNSKRHKIHFVVDEYQ
jgi:hypothetical protein